jgi:hypothetical protein
MARQDVGGMVSNDRGRGFLSDTDYSTPCRQRVADTGGLYLRRYRALVPAAVGTGDRSSV